MRYTYFILLIAILFSGCTEKKVTCPMCNGTGIYAGNMGNDIFAPKFPCSACNRTGQVTESDAKQIIQDMRTVNAMFGDYGDGGYDRGDTRRNNDYDNSCHSCNGSGKCGQCAGRGEYRYEGGYGLSGGITDCAVCKGTGRCGVCHGRGKL